MSTFSKLTARGASGKLYEFQVYRLGTRFKQLPGLYIFCHPRTDGTWFAHYIGQTHDFESRVGTGLPNHHAIAQARRNGATHVAVSVLSGREADRLAVEADLIRQNAPPLNKTGIIGRRAG